MKHGAVFTADEYTLWRLVTNKKNITVEITCCAAIRSKVKEKMTE